MIDLARRALHETGLLPRHGTARYNFLVKRHVQIQVFVENGQYFNLKFSRTDSVAREHAAICEVFQSLPRLVPEPLALVRFEPFQISICRGVTALRISTETIKSNEELFVRTINDYTSQAKSRFYAKGGPGHRRRMASILADLQGAPFLAGAKRWLVSREAEVLERLPCVKQHGDLGRTNLGLAGDRIVVFDWEEFGSVLLPGYDILLLLASQLGFDADRIERAVRDGAPSYVKEIVDFFCDTYEMDRETFLSLMPLMFVIFFHAKQTRGYRFKWRESLMDLIERLYAKRATSIPSTHLKGLRVNAG